MSALADLVTRLSATRRITAEDVLALRRLVFGEVQVTPAEIEALVQLDAAVDEIAPEWSAMFAEAIADYLVRQQHPCGYVDEAGADWLMTAFTRDGRMRVSTELEALIKVLETAESAPPRLAAFALERVREAVVHDGRVTAREVERVRRVLYAFAGQGVAGITREEAEALFDINDAVRGRDNDPAWTELFVKAVASSLLLASTYAAPTRQQALDTEAWLHRRGDLIDGLPRILGPVDFKAAFGPSEIDQAWAARDARVEAEMGAAAALTTDESSWVMARLGRDGVRDAAEQALLDFLQAEASSPVPASSPWAERAA